MPEPTNEHDENAVQVLYDGSVHVGCITRKMSALYRDSVDRAGTRQ